MFRFLVFILSILLLCPLCVAAAGESPVELKNVPDQTVIGLKLKTSSESIASDIGQGYGRLFQYVAQAGIKPAGPPLALFYNPPGPEMDVELAVPAPPDAPGQGEIFNRKLPGGTMASIVHIGPYETLKGTYDTLFAWLKKNDHSLTGPVREVYLSDPSMEKDHSKLKTEILAPIDGK